jgi:hypothetical protein
VTRAAQLVDFRVGIYYLDGNDALEKLARRIEAIAEKTGTEVHKAKRPASFFVGALATERDEIRYGSTAERRAAEELRNLLQEGGFASFPLVQVKNASEGFISIFLAASVSVQAPAKSLY